MNIIQKYFKYRQSLIDQYVKGDMTKSEYLSKNLDAVLELNIKPFKNVDNVEKALFNYQYYNAMAKYEKMNCEPNNKEYINYYYSKKDKATLSILKLIEYENVVSYIIKVNSKYLKNSLCEIVLNDYNMILHSANKVIIENLKREGVFLPEVRKSVIDGYINQKY